MKCLITYAKRRETSGRSTKRGFRSRSKTPSSLTWLFARVSWAESGRGYQHSHLVHHTINLQAVSAGSTARPSKRSPQDRRSGASSPRLGCSREGDLEEPRLGFERDNEFTDERRVLQRGLPAGRKKMGRGRGAKEVGI